MSYYHLYHMNPDSGHIDWFEEIDATDNAAAASQAKARQATEAVELWLDGCRVLQLDGAAAKEPPPCVSKPVAAG